MIDTRIKTEKPGKRVQIKINKGEGRGIYFLIVLVLIAFFSCAIYIQYSYRMELYEKEQELEKKIAEQNELKEELINQSKYYEMDSYVEKIARENLGLVKPNEKIFIDKNK